jgi:hypothetical protein
MNKLKTMAWAGLMAAASFLSTTRAQAQHGVGPTFRPAIDTAQAKQNQNQAQTQAQTQPQSDWQKISQNGQNGATDFNGGLAPKNYSESLHYFDHITREQRAKSAYSLDSVLYSKKLNEYMLCYSFNQPGFPKMDRSYDPGFSIQYAVTYKADRDKADKISKEKTSETVDMTTLRDLPNGQRVIETAHVFVDDLEHPDQLQVSVNYWNENGKQMTDFQGKLTVVLNEAVTIDGNWLYDGNKKKAVKEIDKFLNDCTVSGGTEGSSAYLGKQITNVETLMSGQLIHDGRKKPAGPSH